MLEKDRDHGRARLGLARLEHRRGNSAKSLDHLPAARRDERTRKAAHLLQAEVHHRLGDGYAAKEATQELGKSEPQPS